MATFWLVLLNESFFYQISRMGPLKGRVRRTSSSLVWHLRPGWGQVVLPLLCSVDEHDHGYHLFYFIHDLYSISSRTYLDDLHIVDHDLFSAVYIIPRQTVHIPYKPLPDDHSGLGGTSQP